MADSIYKGILNGLDDKYAAYYTKDEYKDISEKSSGVFCGIGAYMSQNSKTGVLTIIGVVSGGPAEKAGVKRGIFWSRLMEKILKTKIFHILCQK